MRPRAARTPPAGAAFPQAGKSSILPRLLASILVSTTLATAALGSAGILYERHLLLDALHASATRTADYLAQGLAYPLWNFVNREIEVQLNWGLSDPSVYGLVLRAEALGLEPISRSRGEDGKLGPAPPEPGREGFVESRAIEYEGRPIGRLELYATTRFVTERIFREGLAVGALVLILELVLALGLVFLLRVSVFKPLWRIETWASQVSAGRADGLLAAPGEFHGEILSLKTSIENMVGLLQEGYETISARELEYRSLFESNPVPTWELDFSAVKRALGSARASLEAASQDAASTDARAPSLQEARNLIPLIRVRSLNAAAISRLGLEGLARLPSAMNELVTEEIHTLFAEEIDSLAAGQTGSGMECKLLLAGGEERVLVLHFAILAGYEADWSRVVLTAMDITDRALALRELRLALEQKEALIGELFHRTRNSLQIMSSLLSLREARQPDFAYRNELRSLRNRISSMSIAQDLLYQSGDLSSVELDAYIAELLRVLLEGRGQARGRIETRLELEAVSVIIDCALPLGLVLCELVSNVLEHAFPEGRSGRITLRLSRLPAEELELVVSDDGVGVPPGFDPRREAGFGLETVIALGEGQLRGRLSFELDAGFACALRFRDNLFRRRV